MFGFDITIHSSRGAAFDSLFINIYILYLYLAQNKIEQCLK